MISDKAHEKRLEKMDAVIETAYYDNGSTKTRVSDHKRMDDVTSGVILAKKYYLHGNLSHQETEFNPGILYSFVFPKTDDGKVKCPNCGAVGEDALFSDGCPYCGAYYNMQYSSEMLGKKDHSDYVIARRTRLFLPLALIMGISIAVGMFITVTTGRTATFFDYGKGAILGAVFGGLIYLVYAALRSRAALTSEEVRKKREQEIVLERFQSDLGANGLTMGDFVNGLNLGLRDWCFDSDAAETADIIDFDILDYRGQQLVRHEGAVYTSTDILIRFVHADQEKIWSKEGVKRIRLKKTGNTGASVKAGLNITVCPYCGASIDLTKKRCSYCAAPFGFERALTIENVTDKKGGTL